MTFARSLVFGLSLVALLLGPQALLAAKKKASDEGSFRGAIVMDAATGAILMEDRADTVTPPASMTKLMTFAVLSDKLAAGTLTLQTPVTTTAADTRMGGTQVWLKEGEVFPVEELLYAMMIQSANDAAHALARTASGSVDAFVAEMNTKARELGMLHTTFRSPHGLPPSDRNLANSDLTTPRDFALLSRHLVSRTDVLKYTIRQRAFGAPNRTKLVDMINHNHLLGKVDGVDGLKTGFTKQAMYCLAATAQRAGRRVIVVVMGGDTWQSRDYKVIELFDLGFSKIPVGTSQFTALQPDTAAFAAGQPVPADSPFASAPLSSGEKGAAPGASATPGTPSTAEEGPVIRVNLPPARKGK